uniref:extracellular solute-binding protein n=1 Tax=Acetatifactor sp. TaxID=1872090 RepID=UPI004056E3B5
MNDILQILQVVMVVSVIVVGVWLFGGLLGRKAGYRWRKALWFVLAVCLLAAIPLPFTGVMEFSRGIEIQVALPEELALPDSAQSMRENTYVVMSGEEAFMEAPILESNVDEKLIAEGIPEGKASDESVSGQNALEGTRFSLAICIACVWSVGAILFLGFRIWQYGSLKKNCLAETVLCESVAVLECRDRISEEFGISKKIPVRMLRKDSRLINSPMLFGYMDTVLLLPNVQYKPQELEAIMRHELTHYRSKDLWYKLVMIATCDVYWFNPILYLMKKMAFHDVEFVCDEKSTAYFDTDAKKEYSSTILKTMSGTRGATFAFATQFAGNKKSAKERFENIFASHNRKVGVVVLCALVLIIAVGTIFVSVGVSEENEGGEKKITVESSILPENADELLAELRTRYPAYEITAVTPASYYWDEAVDGETPTLYQTWDDEVHALAEVGEVADITDILAERGWLEQMDDAARLLVSDQNGRVYGIPSSVSYAYGIMANAKLFEAAGLVDEAGTPIMPKTWEELAQTAKTIKDATGQAGICFVASTEEYIGCIHFMNMAWNFGATELITVEADGSYKTHLDSDEAIAAMEYIKDLKWEYDVLTEDATKESFNSGYEHLANGTAAMYIGANDALTIPAGYGMNPADIALGAMPAGPGGEQYSYYATNVLVFSADATTEEIDAALTLLEMLGLGPVSNDAAKERIQSKIQSTVEQGGPAIREIPVWKNTELLEYELNAINEVGNTDQALYQSYFDAVTKPGNRKYMNTVANSEFCMEIARVLKAVVTDPNADVTQLMQTANENWQIVVEHYMSEEASD